MFQNDNGFSIRPRQYDDLIEDFIGALFVYDEVNEDIIEPVHEISNNLVCATSKASDQPVHFSGIALTKSGLILFASICANF